MSLSKNSVGVENPQSPSRYSDVACISDKKLTETPERTHMFVLCGCGVAMESHVVCDIYPSAI